MTKEHLRDNILKGMSPFLDGKTTDILKMVVVRELSKIEFALKEELPANKHDLNKYILDMFEFKMGPKRSPETMKAYKTTINSFLLNNYMQLNTVGEMDVEIYLRQLQERGLSAVTVNNNLRNLSAFFTWMRKYRLITGNPCDGIDPYQTVETEIDHLEPTEWDRLKCGCCHKRDRALLEFMRCTAMRNGEIPAVRISDINWSSGELTIYGSKGKKNRMVMIDDLAKEHITAYLNERGVSTDSDGHLFTSLKKPDTPLKSGGLYSSVKEIAKRSGVRHNVYPHLIRKTTATNILRRGGSEEDAGDYLGHAKRTVAGKHYAFKGQEHKKRIFMTYVQCV